MKNIEIEYGHVNDEKQDFIKILKKSKTIVLFRCEDENINRIKLIEDKDKYTIDHYFEAEGLLRGANCRHSLNIDRHIIKKLITPKTEFDFLIYKDAKTNQLCEKVNLHADAIYLNIGNFELLFDVSVNLDNSARIINY